VLGASFQQAQTDLCGAGGERQGFESELERGRRWDFSGVV